MMPKEPMSKERLDRYIQEAARAADYADGFGSAVCDLSSGQWWASYARQSTKEQADNDRLGEYLLTCARHAKRLGIAVPREYVIYDADSSEDLNRPGMIRLRSELIRGRRIAGVIIPSQGRLSMDPLHQLTFERECDYYGVQVVYGDAPGGKDWASQTARLIQAQSNALRVKSTRDNALAGNIGRVLAGKVPALRAPYGYRYRAEKIIEARSGRAKVLRAWWEVDELDAAGQPVDRSPAWVVRSIFTWLADEGRSTHWVTARLNELGVTPPLGRTWTPNKVWKIARRRCYPGTAEYNANGRFPNPDRPLGDLTMGIKRTLVRPKPEGELVTFAVPALTTQERWNSAQEQLTARGRGRGKQGKAVPALLRGRILCPRCQKPMAVLRNRHRRTYYFCRAHYCHWIPDPCRYARMVPGTWDKDIWEELCSLLGDERWLERQLAREAGPREGHDRLVRLEELKIQQAQAKIRKVEDGFEGSLYTLEEARSRKAELLRTVERAQQRIAALRGSEDGRQLGEEQIEALRDKLRLLRERNLREAPFQEQADLVATLGIRVYPTEDLSARRVSCNLRLLSPEDAGNAKGFAKDAYGGARPAKVECGITPVQAGQRLSRLTPPLWYLPLD